MSIFGSLVPCRIFFLGQPPRFTTWLIKQFGLAYLSLLTDAMNCWKKSKTAITQSTVNSLLSGRLLYQHTAHWVFWALNWKHPIQELQQEIGIPSFLSCFPLLSAKLLLSQLIFLRPENPRPLFSYWEWDCSDFSELAPLTVVITLFIFSFSPTLTTKTASLSPTLPQSNPGYLWKKEPNIISVAKLICPVQTDHNMPVLKIHPQAILSIIELFKIQPPKHMCL